MNDAFNCAISPSIDLNHVLAPTIFLGLAIAFAAVYYAYVTQHKDLPTPSRPATPRRNASAAWTASSSGRARPPKSEHAQVYAT